MQEKDELIEIVGGSSRTGEIQIYTAEVVSVARYNRKTDTISVATSHRTWRIVLKSFLKIVVALGVFVLVYSLIGLIIPGRIASAIFWSMIALGAFISLRKIAPWHGAEHKVIEAYLTTGKCNLKTAKRFSPVSDKCGGRLASFYILLLIVFEVFTTFVAEPRIFGFRPSAIIFVTFVLFAQRLRFLYWLINSRPMVMASRAIQRVLSVREPSEIQMQVAHAALVTLLVFYGKSKGISGPGVKKIVKQ